MGPKPEISHLLVMYVAAIIAAANSDIENKIFNIEVETVSINYIADLLKGEKIYIPKRPVNLKVHLQIFLRYKNI